MLFCYYSPKFAEQVRSLGVLGHVWISDVHHAANSIPYMREIAHMTGIELRGKLLIKKWKPFCSWLQMHG